MDEIETIQDIETRRKLLSPLVETIRERCRSARSCPGLSDENFLMAGCLRVIMASGSGREHVQNASQLYDIDIGVSGFFKALRSRRRASMVEECSRELYKLASARLSSVDMLEGFPELDDLKIFAVDGHRIKEASHARNQGKARNVNTLYELDIRNGLSRPLTVAASAEGETHEMKAFRDGRSQPAAKCLEILDRAYVDIQWWDHQARNGATMLTRSKKDMAPFFRRDLQWDRSLRINQGVLSDREAGFNCGRSLRWIDFVDPESGQAYSFITTCWTLSPGLLCMLYLMRWRIEKLYDSFKNKLGQIKAWGITKESRSMQAHFICMAHNLIAILIAELDRDHGIVEEKVQLKRERWLQVREGDMKRKGKTLHIFHGLIRSSSQVTLQFLRSLRNAIRAKWPFTKAMIEFRISMKSYI